MQKFCKFAHLKLTFSILHSYFFKTPISIFLSHTFIQIKYSSSNQSTPTQPPPSTHSATIINPPSPQNPWIKQKIQNWSNKKKKIQNRKSIINHHQPLFLTHFLELLDSHRLNPSSFFTIPKPHRKSRQKKNVKPRWRKHGPPKPTTSEGVRDLKGGPGSNEFRHGSNSPGPRCHRSGQDVISSSFYTNRVGEAGLKDQR